MSGPCPECDGTGYAEDECSECGSNRGWVEDIGEDSEDNGTMTCPTCDGDSSDPCLACDGSGTVDDEESMLDE